MRLSPLDISKQEFSRTLRGYDSAEVRAYLEKVADELAEIEAERTRLQQENLKLQTQLDSYKQMETTLRESLVEAREGSHRERELMLREAKLEAEQIVREAERRTQEARDDLHRLNTQREAYIKRLRFLLSSQQELIDMLEEETPLAEPNHEKTPE